MSTQKLLTSAIPNKWQPKYILKRIGDEDITISQQTRNGIIEQLAKGGKYVQIGEYTIMLNAIKSIDPYWGSKNIPPAPPKEITGESRIDKTTNTHIQQIDVNPEYEEWMELFGGQEND